MKVRRRGIPVLLFLVALALAGPWISGSPGVPAAGSEAAALLPPLARVMEVRVAGGGFLRATDIRLESDGVILVNATGHSRSLRIQTRDRPARRTLWLGSDHQGRDVWARTVRGARVSMSVALLAGGLAMLLGTLYGLAGCMLTGWRRRALEILNDALLGLPRLLLLLMVGLWIGTRGLTPAWAIGAVSWMTVARLVQSEGRALLSQGFFAAARGQGAGKPRLAVFHLLPNLAPVLSVQAALVAAEAVLLEATLSFLGVPGSSALSWGRIVADGQRLLPSGWWIVMFPGLLLFAVALGLQRAAGDAAPDSVTPPA